LSWTQASIATGRGSVVLNAERAGGTQCGKVSENGILQLTCGSDGGVITAVTFASYGQPLGACGSFGVNSQCHRANSVAVLSTACVGNSTCTVRVGNSLFGGDPCLDSVKWLHVQVTCAARTVVSVSTAIPVGSTAKLYLPLLTFDALSPTVEEGGVVVYTRGSFQPGVAGVRSASYDQNSNSILVDIGSGSFNFGMSGTEAVHICARVAEHDTLQLACPAKSVVSHVHFSSFGNTESVCNTDALYTISDCHAGTSVAVIERACLANNQCSVVVDDTVFGDPCFGTAKTAVVDVVCSLPVS